MNKLFLLTISTLLIAGVGFASGPPTDTTTVIILSVNDMHARIDNFPRLKALADDTRKHYENVLLVSAGDMFTGNPVVDQYPDKGYPMIELMNRLGFDIGTIGNHEFDYGQETLLKRIKQANFPLISANIRSADPNGLNPPPYKILTLKNGIKLAFIGAIQLNPAGLPDSHPSKLTGLEFTDGVKKIMEYGFLRDSCNVFVALTHLGFETDVELAKKFGVLDLILGGHSHTKVRNPLEYNGVLVMQAGSGLKYAAKITLKLVDGKLVSKKAELVSIPDYPASNAEIQKLVDHFNDNKELNREIGTALHDITGNDELGSMITDGMCAVSPIEVAFQNNGGIRVDKIAQGTITIKDIYKLDPFGNEIIKMNLSLQEIKSLILSSFNRDNLIDLQISGMDYTVLTGENGKGVDAVLTMPDGSMAQDTRMYNVGLSSYIASSYTFDHHDPGESLYITTAQALINYISAKKEVDYTGVKRTFTRPANN